MLGCPALGTRSMPQFLPWGRPPAGLMSMIALFTDSGLHGPYTGQMKAVLHERAPGVPVIDLFADAPVGNPKASAYLLAAYAAWFPVGTAFSAYSDPESMGCGPPWCSKP